MKTRKQELYSTHIWKGNTLKEKNKKGKVLVFFLYRTTRIYFGCFFVTCGLVTNSFLFFVFVLLMLLFHFCSLIGRIIHLSFFRTHLATVYMSVQTHRHRIRIKRTDYGIKMTSFSFLVFLLLLAVVLESMHVSMNQM